jgi:peptidoglycan/xylan/chitin deacetylase (PgdA/CDA1 family)
MMIRYRAALFLLLSALPACGMHGPPPALSAAAGGVPVLAWHGFADSVEPGGGTLTETYAGFERMVAFMAENGFRSAFPEEVRRGGRQVILTFDDGTKGQLRAAEILERYGFRGIFFIIPTRTAAGDPGFMNADDLERLARAGHRVAAHGYQHRSLPGSGTEVAASLARSTRMLGERAQPSARHDFAFPFGHYTTAIAEAVAGGYRFLHTVNPGYWDGASALLPRMLVMSSVDPALFRAYVLGGAHYRPTLRPLTPDGEVARQVVFLARGPVPEGLELFAITADAAGDSYVSRPLGPDLRVSGDTVRVDLAGYMARHYPPGRIVISYALVTRENGEIRYASPGMLSWIGEPASFRFAPQPARADTAAAPGRMD